MRFIVCFIDDSDFEHDLVHEEIALGAPDLQFVQAYTFDEARTILGATIPVLFLLDLWGQDPTATRPAITKREDLEARISVLATLDSVYQGLDPSQPGQINEYLKRLFTIVDGWRSLFEEVCDRAGQNRKYGLANLREVRDCYPGVPAVFYTRKALINDAVAMFRAGAEGLFIKPTGRDDNETRALTKKKSPILIRELSQIIDRHLPQVLDYPDHYRRQPFHHQEDPQGLLAAWKAFRTGPKT